MGLGFCYRYCFSGERILGLTRYQFELYRRLQSGKSAEQAAQELGIPERIVRSSWSRLRRAERLGVLDADP